MMRDIERRGRRENKIQTTCTDTGACSKLCAYLRSCTGPAYINGDGPEHGNEASVKEAHDGDEDDQGWELISFKVLSGHQEHGAEADADKRNLQKSDFYRTKKEIRD